jgi:hypothetical protein|tara:strand:+ start:567 stop:956 length:390 start_codon:yes stop_codon:yes gene_type:complete
MHDPFLLSGNLGKTEITSQAILATASFPKFQLAQRKATFGYAEQKSIYKEPIANGITIQDGSRRVLPCKKDYIVTVGNRTKDAHTVKPSYDGNGRHTSSIFPRPKNIGDLLTPADSMYSSRQNALGMVY